jgi:hypothetical protein
MHASNAVTANAATANAATTCCHPDSESRENNMLTEYPDSHAQVRYGGSESMETRYTAKRAAERVLGINEEICPCGVYESKQTTDASDLKKTCGRQSKNPCIEANGEEPRCKTG